MPWFTRRFVRWTLLATVGRLWLMKEPKPKLIQIGVRLTPEEYANLQALSLRTGATMAGTLRAFIRKATEQLKGVNQ